MAPDIESIYARNAVAAREEILELIQGNLKNNIVYFDGWDGFGATAVLRSIAQAVPSMKSPPPKLRFGRTIYIDCSRWKSKRIMQRKIAHELKLDQKTEAMFEEQDEEDDFNGVDYGSRDVVREVSKMIGDLNLGTKLVSPNLRNPNKGCRSADTPAGWWNAPALTDELTEEEIGGSDKGESAPERISTVRHKDLEWFGPQSA